MYLVTRNVNTAFRELVSGVHTGTVPTTRRPSRYGEVLQIEEPVVVTYQQPRERVLFNASRDCNPFFHVYESLWMLAGRNEVAPLAYFNSRMREFSDDGLTLNGAYGYRWRHSAPDRWGELKGGSIDQLDLVVQHLQAKPESRRAVIQMWSVEEDLLKVDSSRDVCCNLSACVSLRPTGGEDVLDLTVFNRSNDLIWGLLGANAVHFSFLQEYLAARLRVGVGVYNQVTNNLHCYTKTWEPERWLTEYRSEMYRSDDMYHRLGLSYEMRQSESWRPVPLVERPAVFEEECRRFVDVEWQNELAEDYEYDEPFLQEVARPMVRAYQHHRGGEYGESMRWAGEVCSEDWRIVAMEWLNRRRRRKEVAGGSK